MEPRFEALNDLFKDAEAAQKLLNCTAEEAAVILKEQYNLEFTAEELDEVANGIKAALEEASDELSDEQLEDVVGGGKSTAYYVGYYIGKVIIAGCVIVGGAAAIAALGW